MGDVILGIVITLLCLTPVFVAIGLPISQYLYRRQFKSVFTMDGANCLETKEGNVMIRPRTLRNWIFFVVLLLFLIGLIAAVISGIVGLINGTATIGIGGIIGLGIISIFIGSAVMALMSQLRQTSVYINVDTNLLEIGSGASQRQIPFSTIASVTATPTKRQVIKGKDADTEIDIYSIGVILKDGEEVQFGTISGNPKKSKANVTKVSQLIGQALSRQDDQSRTE